MRYFNRLITVATPMPTIETSRGTFFAADHRKGGVTPTLYVVGAAGTHLDVPASIRRSPILQTVIPDLCGHGESPGNGRTSIEDYALDMFAVLDALDIPHANVIGHSMGGAIGLMMALTASERVSRLILIGAGATMPVNGRIIRGFADEVLATIKMLVSWMWVKTTPQEVLVRGVERMQMVDPNVILGDYIACNGFDVRERLGDIATPTLVIHGNEDSMIPLAEAKAMQEALPNSTLLEVHDGGHMLHHEQEDLVTTSIEKWLQQGV
jgi:pimeloyl-ACP methyl ester carboxylesterase